MRISLSTHTPPLRRRASLCERYRSHGLDNELPGDVRRPRDRGGGEKLFPLFSPRNTRGGMRANLHYALITSSCDEYFAPGTARMFRKYLSRRLLNARVRSREISAGERGGRVRVSPSGRPTRFEGGIVRKSFLIATRYFYRAFNHFNIISTAPRLKRAAEKICL